MINCLNFYAWLHSTQLFRWVWVEKKSYGIAWNQEWGWVWQGNLYRGGICLQVAIWLEILANKLLCIALCHLFSSRCCLAVLYFSIVAMSSICTGKQHNSAGERASAVSVMLTLTQMHLALAAMLLRDAKRWVILITFPIIAKLQWIPDIWDRYKINAIFSALVPLLCALLVYIVFPQLCFCSWKFTELFSWTIAGIVQILLKNTWIQQ